MVTKKFTAINQCEIMKNIATDIVLFDLHIEKATSISDSAQSPIVKGEREHLLFLLKDHIEVCLACSSISQNYNCYVE